MHDVVVWIVPRLPDAGAEYEIKRGAEQVNSRRYQEHNLKLIIASLYRGIFFSAAVINVPAIGRLLANASKENKQKLVQWMWLSN